jgi:hypothetical protein
MSVRSPQIKQSASQGLEFRDLGTINVKGKTEDIKVFSPLPPSVEWPTFHSPGPTSEVKPMRLVC